MKLNDIAALEKQYYSPVFSRAPVCFARGEDVYLHDTEGRRYTDFLSGIATCCLGYSDAGFKQVLHGAVDTLLHTSNLFYVEAQAKAAQALCGATGFDNVFFSNSGAEAVEGALKLARKHHYAAGRPRAHYVTLLGSFHGRTLATLAATGQEKFHEPYRPLPESFSHVPPGDVAALEAAVTEDTAAVIADGGILAGHPPRLRRARRADDSGRNSDGHGPHGRDDSLSGAGRAARRAGAREVPG